VPRSNLEVARRASSCLILRVSGRHQPMTCTFSNLICSAPSSSYHRQSPARSNPVIKMTYTFSFLVRVRILDLRRCTARPGFDPWHSLLRLSSDYGSLLPGSDSTNLCTCWPYLDFSISCLAIWAKLGHSPLPPSIMHGA